jgi:hypothetical protein
MTYQSIDGGYYAMDVWQGRNVSFLTPVGTALSIYPDTMLKIVDAVDAVYDYYVSVTGYTPKPYSLTVWNRRATVAVVDTTCGDWWCSYLGATGVELQTDCFQTLYEGVADYNQYDPSVFQSLGNNFWHYDAQLRQDRGALGDSFIWGYQTFLAFKAIEAAHLQGGSYGPWSFAQYRTNVEGLIDLYEADSSLDVFNTLIAGTEIAGSWLGASDLFASMLLRLGRDHGGDEFFSYVWREVAACPPQASDEEALDNFFLAACGAAQENLYTLFADRWKWPVSAQAQAAVPDYRTSPQTYVLSIGGTPPEGGAVTCSPTQTTYRHLQGVTLTAQPAAGYRFAGWSGDLSGIVNPVTVAMDSDKSITAVFAPGSAVPVAHWKLDETSGTIAYDSAGDNPGVVRGAPSRTGVGWRPTGGRLGGAIQLNGIDQYIDCGNPACLQITGPITVAAWIKADVFDKSWQAIVTKGDTSWRLQRNTNTLTLEFACTNLDTFGVSAYGSLYGLQPVTVGEWHHATGVYDGGRMFLYLDGVLDASQPAQGSIYDNSFSVWIGNNAEIGGRCWSGMIDDVRVYDQALSAQDIKQLLKGS